MTDHRERLIQFKTNIDVVMSLLDRNGLGDWLADRLVEIGDMVKDDLPMHFDTKADPFLDDRLRVANLPVEPQIVSATNRLSGAEKQIPVTLFRKPGEMAGTRRAISEILKWMNYVTDNRFITSCGRPFRVNQSGKREPLGALRSGDESAGHADQGGHSGSRQRGYCDRAGGTEHERGSGEIRRGLGDQRNLWRVHTANVYTGARMEPAEPGQQISYGCAAYSGGALGAGDSRGRAYSFRHLRDSGLEVGSRAARLFI